MNLPRRALAVLALTCAASAAPVEYNRDVRPILSDKCFACHGFDEKAREAKLRLDVAESAYAERDGTIPIKPGDLAKSEAWLRIVSDDAEEVMPPPKSHKKLKPAEKEIIKRWIEEGAKYAGHWSFIPPTKPEVSGANGDGAIDALIHRRLENAGLK